MFMKGKKYNLEQLIQELKAKGLGVGSGMRRILDFFNNYYLTHCVPPKHDGLAFDRVRHVSDFTGVSYRTAKRIMHSLEKKGFLGETVKVSNRTGSEHSYGFTPVAKQYV